MQGNIAKSNFDKVSDLLHKYFDGLYRGDIALLADVFHPQAHYSCATNGELLQLAMPEYFKVVDNRDAPIKVNQPRIDKIIAIEFAGDVTALAKVECAIGNKHFTDFLNLIYVNSKWQIIAKVFHYQQK